jgi:hypothetical protein
MTLDYVPRPGVLSVDPRILTLGRQEVLTVTGANFSEDAEVSVSGEGVDILAAERSGDGELLVTAVVSRDAGEGERDLTVTNGGPGLGLEATLPGALELTEPTPPRITGLSPGRGLPGESLLVRVDGERLTEDVRVSFTCSELAITDMQRSNPDVLFMNVSIPADAEPRACGLSAGDDFGRSFTLDDAFRIEAPPAVEQEMEAAGGGCALAGPGNPAPPALALLAFLFVVALFFRRRA